MQIWPHQSSGISAMTAGTVELKNHLSLMGVTLDCQHILQIRVRLLELLKGERKH